MTYIELSQIKEKDVIYDESAEIGYKVSKKCKSGILTSFGFGDFGFTKYKFFKYEELLDKNMILKRNDNTCN